MQIIRQAVQMAMQILTTTQRVIPKARPNPIYTCPLIQTGPAPIQLAKGLAAQDQEEMPTQELKVYSEKRFVFSIRLSLANE